MIENNPKSNDSDHHFREKMALRAIETLPMIIGYWGRDEKCYFANNLYKEWFGCSVEDMVGITLEQLLGPLYALNEPFIRSVLNGQTQIFERDITTPAGELRHALATYTPDFLNGEVIGFFAHVADISKFKRLEREWETIASEAKLDSLTGLLNRRAFDEKLQGITHLANIEQSQFSLVIIDIDSFKEINDSFGHKAGDAVLQVISQRLLSALRESDLIARWGGDEFSIVLRYYKTRRDVLNLVERIRMVSSNEIQYGSQTLRTSVSVGAAFFPEDGVTPTTLFTSADMRLYKDKRQK